MEAMLAVKKPSGLQKGAREMTFEADKKDEDEGQSRARDRYQRHFWEPVAEGDVRDGSVPVR